MERGGDDENMGKGTEERENGNEGNGKEEETVKHTGECKEKDGENERKE